MLQDWMRTRKRTQLLLNLEIANAAIAVLETKIIMWDIKKEKKKDGNEEEDTTYTTTTS